MDQLDPGRLAKAVGDGMWAIEDGSQQRIRTLKHPLQEGDERGAQELHLSQLVDD